MIEAYRGSHSSGEFRLLPLVFIGCGGAADRPQILRNPLASLPVHLIQTDPYHVHDAELNGCPWIDRLDGLGKTFQPSVQPMKMCSWACETSSYGKGRNSPYALALTRSL
jgi:hypothetical protein